MAKGTIISAPDYNSIRTKVVSVLGTGLDQRGYGQPVASSLPVSTGNEITAAQWNALRNDIVSIRLHQEGVEPSIVQLSSSTLIEFGAGNPNFRFNTLIDQAILTRFNIATSRSLITSRGTRTFSSAWNTLAQATLTVTFDNSDDARYFFNSGGKIRFTSSRTGGTISQQNNAWTNLLNSIGIFQFGANTPDVVNFYSLTSSYQIVLQQAPSGVYGVTGSSFKIEAKCNVAKNSTGTANVIDFRISWVDEYTDPGPPPPGDLIDGTLTLIIEELKASGPLVPSGTFVIVSPAYSLSNITAT